MNKPLGQRVIQKCIEVLGKTEDGARLTAKELEEVEFLSNNYHKLSAKMTEKALCSLDNMLVCRRNLKHGD